MHRHTGVTARNVSFVKDHDAGVAGRSASDRPLRARLAQHQQRRPRLAYANTMTGTAPMRRC